MSNGHGAQNGLFGNGSSIAGLQFQIELLGIKPLIRRRNQIPVTTQAAENIEVKASSLTAFDKVESDRRLLGSQYYPDPQLLTHNYIASSGW